MEPCTDAVVVRIPGEIATVILSTLVDGISEALRGTAALTVVDLTAAEYIDGSGMYAVLGLHLALENEGRRLVVACSSNVRRVFEMGALHHRITLVATVREGLAADAH